ncbi:hypothetical protein STIAU_3655 [Stigmatella aurantiaca DW4/3-1]|uniref:NurA domain-containing protein n=2 Tax=Stigmatella aurantiaca (strain DW4/3-1) TaxID=378806 RepID=Q09CI2_STIAD|nr:hypothetical protein STIAU_3655 [Stigmatella aurantiaca DW4/3-1]
MTMIDDALPDGGHIGNDDFLNAFGERLSDIIDFDTWDDGVDAANSVERFRSAIAEAVREEDLRRAVIRRRLLARLSNRPNLPKEAGVYRVKPEEMTIVHEGLLFPGHVEAVYGTAVVYDSLPIGITQIGVAAVGYGGTSGTFSQRLFHRDISSKRTNAVEEALAVLHMRQERSDGADHLPYLARRGIKSYAERAILLDKSEAEWRIGHGNPCSRELLTGVGYMGLLEASLHVLRRLIQKHKKFVFVPDALEQRGYLTIGNALKAGEYAILTTLEAESIHAVKGWKYGGSFQKVALDFVEECCPEILVGLFRISEHAQPCLFYAHRQHVHMAARIAMADSILRPERGFPMLLDVADVACRGAFSSEGFLGMVHDAYAQSGAKLQYFGERETRR